MNKEFDELLSFIGESQLRDVLDLTPGQLAELVDRAQYSFDFRKRRECKMRLDMRMPQFKVAESFQALASMMEDDGTPANVRLGCAKLLLEYAYKVWEGETLAQRLEALEERCKPLVSERL